MKYIKPYLLLLPQIFVGIIFLVGIGIGITQSFGVVPVFNLYKPTFKYYAEIFMRKDTIDSIFYSLKIAFVSSLVRLFLQPARIGHYQVCVSFQDNDFEKRHRRYYQYIGV